MDANYISPSKKPCHCCFNPRARDGREKIDLMQSRKTYSFNPRARDGRELGLIAAGLVTDRFNPRARDGREHHLYMQTPCF